MNSYRCTDGTRVTKAVIDRNIRTAKALLIESQKQAYGYNFCTECFQNDCKPLDCAHIESVDSCQKNGHAEKAWDINNMRIMGRSCHQHYDKNQINYK